MLRIITGLLMVGVSWVVAQEQPKEEPIPELYSPTSIIEDQNKIYERVELEPQFSTDHRSLNSWIGKEIEQVRSRKKLPRGTITVKLLIEKNGAIGDAIFLDEVNKKLRKETLEIIKRMPGWRAGAQNGRPVRAFTTVTFAW